MERRNNNNDRIGISLLSLKIEQELKWIFREQTVNDFGIDAIIEEVNDGNPTGKLIAVQVKSGLGNVVINKDGDFDFYFNQIHYDYWLGHNIPVIMVICNTNANEMYWTSISERYIKRTSKNYKLTINKKNILNNDSIIKLERLINSFSAKVYYDKEYVNTLDLSIQKNVDELIHYICEIYNETTDSIRNTSQIILDTHISFETQFERLQNFIDKNKNGVQQNIIDNEVREVAGNFAQALNIFSQKLRNEIKVTSETHTKALQLTNYYLASCIINEVELFVLVDELEKEIVGINQIIHSVNTLSNYYKNDKTRWSFEYTQSKNNCIDVLELYSEELYDLISMINISIKLINKK